MNVLVTGGGGLVGSHVIEHLLARGHTVRALVRDNAGRAAMQALGAEPVFGLVEQESGWGAAQGVDAIVHAAALIRQRAPWERFVTVNVDGTRLAAEAARRNGARLVHVSSIAVYHVPDTHGVPATPIAEDAPLRSQASADSYARSKILAEQAIAAATEAGSISAVVLRPPVVYGERDRLFIPKVLAALRLGLAPLIGSGDNALALVYAGNLADAVVAALERPAATGVFNVTNDGRITQRGFFETIARAAGRRVRFVRFSPEGAMALGRTWESVRHAINPSRYPGFGAAAVRFLAGENPYTSARATRELGWTPGVAPVAALERSVRWLLQGD